MDDFENNQNQLPEDHFEDYGFQANKEVDVKEALTYMFKNGNAPKFWGGAVIYGLMAVIIFAIMIHKPANLDIIKWVGLYILFMTIQITLMIIWGYTELCQHDRALSADTTMRDFSGNLLDALFVSSKNSLALFIYYFFIFICVAILIFITFILLKLNIILGAMFGLISIIISIAVGVYMLIYFFNIIPYYSTNLKFVSWFKKKEAFQFCKDVHYGAGAIFTYIGLLLLLSLSFPSVLMVSKGSEIILLISTFLMYVGIFYLNLLKANIFGQFAYNAVEKNMKIRPESLPKEINKDKGAIIFSVIYLILMLTVMFAHSFILPLLITKQADTASRTKLMKSIVTYEDVATVYMIENEVNNVSGMMGYNCENANQYFRVAEQDGCNFETTDGAYWKFNYDGSAEIFPNSESDISLKVGVCKDRTVNCESEYPETSRFKDFMYSKHRR